MFGLLFLLLLVLSVVTSMIPEKGLKITFGWKRAKVNNQGVKSHFGNNTRRAGMATYRQAVKLK